MCTLHSYPDALDDQYSHILRMPWVCFGGDVGLQHVVDRLIEVWVWVGCKVGWSLTIGLCLCIIAGQAVVIQPCLLHGSLHSSSSSR